MSKNVAIFAVLILALAPRALAQVNAGEASINLNGSISAGYGDDTSNFAGSDHSLAGAGNADLSGFYYNPNFLSFDVQPFYNQSRLDSSYQSVTASSGVNASARIFGGSHFPGSVSYTDNYNTSGNFSIPGQNNYTTHGNSDALGISWGVNLPNLPTLHLSFSDAQSNYSIYGADAEGTLHEVVFSVSSVYRIAGFRLNGGYQHTSTQTDTPAFLAGEASEHFNTGDNLFNLSIGHNLPWHGDFSASATRADINTNYDDTLSPEKYKTTIDTLTSGVGFAPATHLSVGANGFYTDNLEGTLYNTLLTAGATVPLDEGQESSHSLALTAYANYDIPAHHLYFNTFAEHQEQTFMGSSLGSDAYNGTATYSNELRGGSFNGVLGVTRTSVSTSQESLLGLDASVSYAHSLRQWVLAGGFTYSQDTQTVLVGYTTSGYSYNGSMGRRIRRRTYWSAGGGGSRTLLTGEPGTASSAQSYSTTLSMPRFSFNGAYSISSGNALLTSTGLVSTPIPVSALPPSAVVLYNGRAFSLGVGSNPVRGLTLSASYSKSLSTTNSNSLLSNNNNENMFFLMIYHFRKLDFQAGYSRLVQGFSASGTAPTMVNSFYVGVGRWFNFF